jgi:hypothetical protein
MTVTSADVLSRHLKPLCSRVDFLLDLTLLELAIACITSPVIRKNSVDA